MECLDTIKSLKINFKRNIGTVLLIVEGTKDEFDLLKQIFRNVLHYNYIEKNRNQEKFKNYDEFIMKGNENSKVIVINSKNSNISSIEKDENYLNEIYKTLYNEYQIDIKNIRVYFIWDRDYASNPAYIIESLIGKLTNSLDTLDGQMHGLLLLSYPCVEAYIISNFDKKTLFLKEKNLKKYIKNNELKIEKINKHSILNAVVMMHKSLKKLGIKTYDLENFKSYSLNIFKKQELILKEKDYYYLLSLISIIFLDTNIITIKENN